MSVHGALGGVIIDRGNPKCSMRTSYSATSSITNTRNAALELNQNLREEMPASLHDETRTCEARVTLSSLQGHEIFYVNGSWQDMPLLLS